MDRIDYLIVKAIEKNAKMPIRRISKITKIAPTTVYSRLQKLEREGIIRGYYTKIAEEKLGRTISAYILIKLLYTHLKKNNITQRDFTYYLSKHPLIVEASTITGRKDVLVKVKVKDMEELNRVIEQIRNADYVMDTETMVAHYDAPGKLNIICETETRCEHFWDNLKKEEEYEELQE